MSARTQQLATHADACTACARCIDAVCPPFALDRLLAAYMPAASTAKSNPVPLSPEWRANMDPPSFKLHAQLGIVVTGCVIIPCWPALRYRLSHFEEEGLRGIAECWTVLWLALAVGRFVQWCARCAARVWTLGSLRKGVACNTASCPCCNCCAWGFWLYARSSEAATIVYVQVCACDLSLWLSSYQVGCHYTAYAATRPGQDQHRRCIVCPALPTTPPTAAPPT